MVKRGAVLIFLDFLFSYFAHARRTFCIADAVVTAQSSSQMIESNSTTQSASMIYTVSDGISEYWKKSVSCAPTGLASSV